MVPLEHLGLVRVHDVDFTHHLFMQHGFLVGRIMAVAIEVVLFL